MEERRLFCPKRIPISIAVTLIGYITISNRDISAIDSMRPNTKTKEIIENEKRNQSK
jgi:hypothetical protein